MKSWATMPSWFIYISLFRNLDFFASDRDWICRPTFWQRHNTWRSRRLHKGWEERSPSAGCMQTGSVQAYLPPLWTLFHMLLWWVQEEVWMHRTCITVSVISFLIFPAVSFVCILRVNFRGENWAPWNKWLHGCGRAQKRSKSSPPRPRTKLTKWEVLWPCHRQTLTSLWNEDWRIN